MRVLLVGAAALLAGAAPALAQEGRGGWVDVTFGAAAAAEDEYTAVRLTPSFGETARGVAVYTWPRGASFDVGGGNMFNGRVGLGASMSGTVHQEPAALAISVPHPRFFDAFAADASVTSGALQRAEGALHVHAMFVAAETPRVRLRVFGGPSRFQVEQDVVERIMYDQVYQLFLPGNVVDITSYSTEKSSASAWGLHGGLDVSVFFTRVVGLGGMLRVSRAAVELEDYGGVSEIEAGGLQFGAGLRLRL